MTSPPRKVLIVETDYHTMMPICIKNKTPIPVSSEDEESCPSPVYQLEDLHVKVKELLEYRQSYKELFSKTTELVKETLETAYQISPFKNRNFIDNLMTGQELVSLLELILNESGDIGVKSVIRNVNHNLDTILLVLAQYRELNETIHFLKWLAEIDKEFTKTFINFTNSDKRNVLHNIAEYGANGSTKMFLIFLVNTFEMSFVRDLLRTRAYSLPKSDELIQKPPKLILKYSPLHLLVYNNEKGIVSIVEFLSLLDWLHYHTEYQFVGELLTIEDVDECNVMHRMTRYSKNVGSLITLLDFAIKNVKYDFVRRFLMWPLTNGTEVLTLQCRASPESEETVKFLKWILIKYRAEFLKELLGKTTLNDVNAVMAVLCHPDYLKKAQAVLLWVFSFLGIQMAYTMMRNYEIKLMEFVQSYQNLKVFFDFMAFVFVQFKEGFARKILLYVCPQTNSSYLHYIVRHNEKIEYNKKFISFLLSRVPKQMAQQFLQTKDSKGKIFLHYFMELVKEPEKVTEYLNWMIDAFDFEVMEELLTAVDDSKYTPVHYTIQNESQSNFRIFAAVLYWIRRNLGPDVLKTFLKIEDNQNMRIFEFVVRYKNDTGSLIEVLKWLANEYEWKFVTNVIRKADPRSKDWTLLHYIFRYNSNEQAIKFFLNWICRSFGSKFVDECLQLKRDDFLPLECLAENSAVRFTEILEYIEAIFHTNYVVGLLKKIFQIQRNSVINIMLDGSHSLEQIEETLKWMEKTCPVTMKDMYLMIDREKRIAVELAKRRGNEFFDLVSKFVCKSETIG